jgi:predicted nucleic acid-binding protein
MSGLEELLTGRTLVNRYRIQEVIGRGGFAAVYRAEDERLGRPVAVKVITVAAPDAVAAGRHRERFEREARAAASLPQHPNVVTVHDFGVDPQLELDFLVMEFLHGEDLATRLRRKGRPPEAEALRILRDAATGVAVGHRAGIVHRDVKPGNIFLAKVPGAEEFRVCILDFGIARVVADDQTLTGLPGDGTPLSPAYASPEQSRGLRDLTPASDVFSLSVVAYELLTGEKPYAGPRGSDPSEWIPRCGVREVNPAVPEWLESVILRASAYDPAGRFADADELAAALAYPPGADRTLLASSPAAAPQAAGQAAGDETLYQPAPFEPARDIPHQLGVSEPSDRRRRAGVIPVLVALLAVGGAAAGWLYLTDRSAEPAPDPTAAAELESISEELDEDGGDAPGPQSVTPSAETGPPVEISPDTLLSTFPALPGAPAPGATEGPMPIASDTAPRDTSVTPAPSADTSRASADTVQAAADTVQPPADSAPPSPRVLGVPVDTSADEASASRKQSARHFTRPHTSVHA